MPKLKLPLPTSEVICSDNLAYLKTLPDNYFDSVVTDPPYGLGKEPDAMEVLKDWIEKGYHEVKTGPGFMGKLWDSFVPQPNFWKEVFRVLKPGGYVLAFGGTRTYDWMVISMRLGGFKIKDQLQWVYSTGFPKSMNISKAIDKAAGAEREVIGKVMTGTMNSKPGAQVNKDGKYKTGQTEINVTAAATDEAKQWEGWGTAAKPAYEPIVLAQKPISEKTIVENVLKYGTGAINIDGCRIEFTGEKDLASATFGRDTDILSGNYVGATHGNGLTNIEANPKGRWPANIIFSHHPECECIGIKKISGTCTGNGNAKKGESSNGTVKSMRRGGEIIDRTDKNGLETVDHYNCHPDCPVRILDEQTGILKSGKPGPIKNGNNNNVFGNYKGGIPMTGFGDSGGASRFFYCAKASKSERNKGLESIGVGHVVQFTREGGAWQCLDCERKYQHTFENCPKCGSTNRELYTVGSSIVANTHPTVKPVKLMQYLVRLITPPGGTVLDPFNGLGTTGIACKLEGFNYVGIDDTQEHVDISIARIAAWEPEPEDYNNQISLFDDV